MRPAFVLSVLASSVIAIAPSVVHAQQKNEAPRMDYYSDGYRDDRLTQNSTLSDYRGRWTGTWEGADGRIYKGSYEGNFQGEQQRPAESTPMRDAAPNPAYIGSGQVINGWYYPAPVVVTTTTEYVRAK